MEGAALGGVLALLVADLLQAPPLVVGSLAAVAAATHMARLSLWRPWKTFGAPMVWILHVACGWIAVHLLLRVLAAAGLLPDKRDAPHTAESGLINVNDWCWNMERSFVPRLD